jgi:hypothetical protein
MSPSDADWSKTARRNKDLHPPTIKEIRDLQLRKSKLPAKASGN